MGNVRRNDPLAIKAPGSPQKRMAIFDALPKEVREALAGASVDYAVKQAWDRWVGCGKNPKLARRLAGSIRVADTYLQRRRQEELLRL